MRSLPSEVGQRLPNGFSLTRVIGGGTTSSPIVLARHSKGLLGTVRIKSFFADAATREEQAAMSTEIRALQTVAESGGHPNVLSLLETIEGPGEVHLVLEPCLGGSLRDRLGEFAMGAASGMPEPEAYAIASQLASALDALHAAGVAHRALSPEAVCFASSTQKQIVLSSFANAELTGAVTNGAAERAGSRATRGSRSVTEEGGGCTDGSGCPGSGGLPHYRAPEAWGCDPFAGAPADMWSFGTILYEMLHGRPCFDGDTLPALSLQIRRGAHRPMSSSTSSAAVALMRACLVREPMMRAGPRRLKLMYLKAWERVTADEA